MDWRFLIYVSGVYKTINAVNTAFLGELGVLGGEKGWFNGGMSPELILESKVPPAFHGKTLIEYLCVRFPYHTREGWEKLIFQYKVRVNGQKPGAQTILHKGNVVSYASQREEPPVDRNLAILHEEDSFLVAFKPGNLPSHADGQYITHTFIFILKELKKAAGYTGFLSLVHRLDRETSGIMVVAKTREAHKSLTRQFEEGAVAKEYLAWVKGVVAEDRFESSLPIGKDPASKVSIRRKVLPEGTEGAKPAKTLFEVVERRENRTLVKCLPQTGRTHQIRVHLEGTGHPVVGDKLYGMADSEFLEFVKRAKEGWETDWTKKFGAERQLLHAARLAFKHPVTGEPVVFTSELPADMKVG